MFNDFNPNYVNRTNLQPYKTLLTEIAVALGANESEIADEIHDLRIFIRDHHAVRQRTRFHL